MAKARDLMPMENDDPKSNSERIVQLNGNIRRGAIWSLAINVLVAPLNLIVMGWMLSRLGAEKYGVLILISSISYYLRFGDFGLSWAFSKLVAERISSDEVDSLGRSMGSVTSMIVLSGSILCLVSWLLKDAILYSIFRIPLQYARPAELTFAFVLLATLIGLIAPVFASVLIGAQRTDIERQISGCVNLIGSVGAILRW